MAVIAKKYRDQLDRLKENIENSIESFSQNVTRYWDSKRFICVTAQTDSERSKNIRLGRPTLESNSLEPYIIRQVGEISKQLPEPSVQPKIPDDISLASQAQIVEDHIRHIFDRAINLRIESFQSAAEGGFYVFKVITDYINKKLDQGIFIQRVYNVAQTGFDPLAQESHKGDGKYSWERVPMLKEDFEEEHPEEALDDSLFSSSSDNWFYQNGTGKNTQKFVVIYDYYEKKSVFTKTYLTSNPLNPDSQESYTEEEYEEKIREMENNGFTSGEMPKILKTVNRKNYKIEHYKLIGNRIIDHESTDLEYLPHIFVDGRSVKMENNQQITRPLVYHAMDIQKSKNITFQTILNDIENKEQTKTYLPVAGLPVKGQYLDSWLKIQTPHAARFYNHTDENGDPIPAPTSIPSNPLDANMIAWYTTMDQSIQYSMGSFDTQQGIQTSDMAGIAIDKGANQSNNATMINVINYKQAWTQAAKICVNLMPKYYTTARSIPILTADGDRSYRIINDSVKNPLFKIEYEEEDMDVDVKMDLSFDAQKSITLQNIERGMKASPLINKFFSTVGCKFYLDNMTFRDQAKVKAEFDQFMKDENVNQVKDEKFMMDTNPVIAQTKIEQMKLEEREKDRKLDLIKTIAETKIDERKIELEETKAQAEILESRDRLIGQALQAQSENMRSQIDAALSVDKHAYDKIESERAHAHQVRESDRAHVLDLVNAIGELKNVNAQKQEVPEEGQQADEEGMLNE